MKIKSNIGIYICNYNTNTYTNNCIKSVIDKIKSFTYSIYVFDNSDKIIFDNIYNVNVIDNTDSKILNFNKFIEGIKDTTKNNFGSLKHSLSIDYILKKSNHNNILLLDSDTILLRDIDFIDDNYITISDRKEFDYKYTNKSGARLYKRRFLPFIQYFNKKKILENNLDYCDNNRIVGINTCDVLYDTGASFYEDVLKYKLEFKIINHYKYIKHYGGKSWSK